MTGVARALEPVVAAEVSALVGASPAGRAHMEASPRRAVGDVRFDLRPLLGARAGRDECRAVAERLAALDPVQAAVGIPPRVYLRLDPGFLAECATGEVLAARELYGSSRASRPRLLLLSYSDPNLNKPLHVGHLRNNFLGMAIANLCEARGWTVERQASHLNWGLDIAKTLIAYRRWGKGATPASEGTKGDHFVGRFYTMFHQRDALQAAEAAVRTEKTWDSVAGADAGRTRLEREALEVLARLDRGDPELTELNARVTGWAEEGILQTYERIGTRMDALYYEGDHLEAGRALVARMWERGLLRRRPDGSACADLDLPGTGGAGNGEITFLRADGTPLIYRQWMATDVHRFASRDFDRAIFLFGREWADGFAVFAELLRRLGHHWVEKVRMPGHGMVSLPEGPMQSRYGNAVTADDLLDRVAEHFVARWPDRLAWSPGERAKACDRLAVGLLKYAFLRIEREHDWPFDEERLWRHVWPRFALVLRALAWCEDPAPATVPYRPEGKRQGHTSGAGGPTAPGEPARTLALLLDRFPETVARAAEALEPALVVRLLDDIASAAETGCRDTALPARLREAAGVVIRRALGILNIEAPEGLGALVPEAPPPGAGAGAGAGTGHETVETIYT